MEKNKGKNGRLLFSLEDHQFIRENWPQKTNQELATALGFKLTRLRNELASMGLKRMEQEYWTPDQVKFLKSNYKVLGDAEIAKMLQQQFPKSKKWTKSHISKKRGYLNLSRTPEEVKAILTRNLRLGNSGFIKGYAEIGEKRIWKTDRGVCFMVIKTEKGFVWHNRWLYESVFGKLKKGQIVVPKDRFKIDCTIDDLEVIDHSEMMYRNLEAMSLYPSDLKEVNKILNKLKKVINENRH